ncbi:MAG: serine hydrolase domain-containing protein [Gemmatimonadota bacterium]|nr:serine hydrolase domain-containing protein [Gemmatimonadota bacterium]
MDRIHYLGLAFVLVVRALCTPVPRLIAQSLPAGAGEEIEALVRERMESAGIPGLSVAIALEGGIVWAEGFGTADVENGVPAGPETAYRTASIGKPMTATAVMQLWERGRLDLDAAIQEYCPAFPRKRWTVTTRHLLAHLGGVRHYGGPNAEAELFNTRHYDDVIEPLGIFSGDPLVHEPGSAFLYTTFGYNILGCVIAGASGGTYLDYMTRHVFEPAGMRATRDDDPAAIIPNRARGYRRSDEGELVNARMVDMSSKLPAGGFITTAPDLVRFATAVMDGTLVSAETFDEMLTPQTTSSGEITGYGLGWGLIPDEDWYGEKEALHGGGTPQVSGMLYLLPGRRFAVAILANLEGVDDRVGLAAQIARIALDLDGSN